MFDFRCKQWEGEPPCPGVAMDQLTKTKHDGPPCPMCGGETEQFYVTRGAFFHRDEYPGGITLENYGRHPVTFYSESERIAYLKREGLNQKERWVPLPGTDRDPAGVQRPDAYIDDYTRRNREELFLRANNKGVEPPVDTSEQALGDTFEGVLTARDAKAIAGGDAVRSSRLARRMSHAK